MLDILNIKFISVSEVSERTGFSSDDLIIDLQRKGITPIHMGNNYYLTADMLSVLFSQDGADNFVTNQPICAADIDNRPTAELSFSQRYGKEVLRVANATISLVRKEGRKKPFMVQRRVYFEDGSYKRVSKCFATREEAEEYAATVNGEREQSRSRSESVHIETTANSRQALGLSDYSAILGTGIEGTQAVGGNMSFYNYMLYYIKDSGQCTCGDRTKKCYMDTAERIHKELDEIGKGSITLCELDDIVLNTVIKNIASCSGGSLVSKVYGFIKRVLGYSFAIRYINRDIVPLLVKAKCVKKSKNDSNRKPYEDEEIQMMLDAAKSNTRLYAMIVLALYSGMRPAEIRALRWSDIDWSNGEIHVNGAVKREYTDLNKSSYIECVGSTKSEYGIRDIPLADSTAEALTEWRAESESSPIGSASEYIFYSADGSAMNENQFNSLWRRFISSHGWKGKGYFLYRFRHTFCTRLLLSGRTPQEVQALMGDSTLAVIMNIYNGIKSRDVLERSRDTVNGIFEIA